MSPFGVEDALNIKRMIQTDRVYKGMTIFLIGQNISCWEFWLSSALVQVWWYHRCFNYSPWCGGETVVSAWIFTVGLTIIRTLPWNDIYCTFSFPSSLSAFPLSLPVSLWISICTSSALSFSFQQKLIRPSSSTAERSAVIRNSVCIHVPRNQRLWLQESTKWHRLQFV